MLSKSHRENSISCIFLESQLVCSIKHSAFDNSNAGKTFLVVTPLQKQTVSYYTVYRISSYSFRRNYSFLKLTLCTMTFGYSPYRCRNYSREETIQGRKIYEEIRQFVLKPFNAFLLKTGNREVIPPERSQKQAILQKFKRPKFQTALLMLKFIYLRKLT